jgi:recombination protein RecT
MTADEIIGIRNRTDSWKAHEREGKKTPWKTDPGEMWKKTVVKQASKWWPKSERVQQAVHYLNNEGGEGLAPAVSELDLDDENAIIAGVYACGSQKALREYFAASQPKFPEGSSGYQRLRAAANEHREALKSKS